MSKGHGLKLVKAGKGLDFVVASVALHALSKDVLRQIVDDLGEHQLAK